MRFIKNSRNTKCKRCGESKKCYKDTLKGVNICPECLEPYKDSKVNCASCKKSFKRGDEFVTEDPILKTKNFCCEKCYNDFKAELEEKDKMNEWLKEYFKVDKLPSRIYMQMEDFKNKKGISYKWTFATLRYLVNIKGDELQDGTIGIVPYAVDECKDHVKKLRDIKKRAKESETCRAKFSENVIVIKNIDVNKERERVMSSKIITESDLEGVILW